jgi:branched-chain amino acid transport system permease protein
MAENAPRSPLDHPLRVRAALALLAGALALPWVAHALGETFYIGVASRVLVFAMAASALNLVLGFGGLVSFGHAAFLGIGAYSVGVLMQHGVASAWLAWPLAALAGATVAALVAAVSLRTRGVYFIMITLAFAQMLYFLMVSLKTYGGDDGLSLPARSSLSLGPLGALDLSNDTVFYHVVLALFVAVFLGLYRLLNARFGHALQAMRDNETRMAALGHPVWRVRLVAFALSGAIAALAGALLANQNGYVSPALMQWSQSGMLMVMVILGGVGHLYGGLVGAATFLLLEEVLVAHTVHWQLGLGAVLLAVVLAAPNGLLSLGRRWRKGP